MSHHVRLDLTEHPMKDPVLADIDHQRNRHRADGDEPDQLRGGTAGPFLPFLAQVLAGHHRAPGGQGREQVDQKHHDVVHQGHARTPQPRLRWPP